MAATLLIRSHAEVSGHTHLNCASYGVVKMLNVTSRATGTAYQGLTWEPKRSFYALAEYYAQ